MLAATTSRLQWQSTELWLGYLDHYAACTRSKSRSNFLKQSSIHVRQYFLVVLVLVALLY
jgi:hypothetical protein